MSEQDDIWYLMDHDGHIETYETGKHAENAAIDILNFYEEEAKSDGWPDNIGEIQWGRLTPYGRANVEVHGRGDDESWSVHMEPVAKEWPFGLDDEQQKALEVIAGLMRKAKQ